MFKFVNKTSGRVWVNECRLRKDESSPWYKSVNETFTCNGMFGTLIIKVGKYGIHTIKKQGTLSAIFDGTVVEIYEKT